MNKWSGRQTDVSTETQANRQRGRLISTNVKNENMITCDIDGVEKLQKQEGGVMTCFQCHNIEVEELWE